MSPRSGPDAVEAEDVAAYLDRSARGVRRAVLARYGSQVGEDVYADVVAYAVEHWDALHGMDNIAGYLFRVAQSQARRYARWGRIPARVRLDVHAELDEQDLDLIEVLNRLPPDLRVAVLLVKGYGYTYREAADILDIPVTSLTNHVHRGMARLRRRLQPGTDDERRSTTHGSR